jgi:outer membrane protein TolC
MLLASPLLSPRLLLAADPATLELGLDEAIAKALGKNIDLRVERENVVIADANVDRAKGAYDPALRLDARYRDRTDAINSILSGAPAGEVGPSASGGLLAGGVSQLLSTGGTVSLSTSLSRETTNNTFSLLSPSYVTSLGLELRQPLLQNRSVDPARRGLRVARIDRDRSTASLRRAVAETVAAVEKSYWTLVAARREVEARTSAVALAMDQRADVRSRFEAGVLSEADLAAPTAELERRRGDLFGAEEGATRAENTLKALLGGDPSDPVWTSRIVPVDQPALAAGAAADASVDSASSVATAVSDRPELAEAASRIARSAVEEEVARGRLLPQLDLVGAYTGRGLAGSKNPDVAAPFPGLAVNVPPALDGGLGRSYGTLFDNRFPDASIGLALTVPVGNRVARADAAIARSARVQAEASLAQVRQRVEVEVLNAVAGLRSAAQRVEAARAGRDAAETLLKAENDRFAAGTTTPFFVLTRQNDLTQARIAEAAALTDHRKARTELARAKGTLLEERNIRIEDHTPGTPAGGSR